MALKPQLPNSLRRLLRRVDRGGKSKSTDWISWLTNPQAKQGLLTLVRAGEDIYTTHILDARLDEENSLALVVDRLIPDPEGEFWGVRATVHGKLVYIEAGIEVTTSFRASASARMEFQGDQAGEFVDLDDLEVTSREYIADLGESHHLELGMIWYGRWIQIIPDQASIHRLFFDAELEGHIGPDGYAVPKSILKLERGGAEIPVRLQLFRRHKPQFEAKIEKIDGVAQQKITAIVEDIWRVASGLSRKRHGIKGTDVGYMSRDHDPLAEAFEPQIALFGFSEPWAIMLADHGIVRTIDQPELNEAVKDIAGQRCDLIVADADAWGDEVVKVERKLRSVSTLRNIPRIWYTKRLPKREKPGSSDSGQGLDDQLDLLMYGAFDLLPLDIDARQLARRVEWALGGDTIGEGQPVVLVSLNTRLRYRLGVELGGKDTRFVCLTAPEGLLPAIEKIHPKWVLLDADSYDHVIDKMVSATAPLVPKVDGEVLVLSRGAKEDRIFLWLNAGAKDIVVLDPSLRQAAERIRERMQGEVN